MGGMGGMPGGFGGMPGGFGGMGGGFGAPAPAPLAPLSDEEARVKYST